ncbi:MAG: hemerythrin domain-containing protein [Pedobacter sp.]|jgi:iron-sulfur cluster repair protein YtfE (RIC family)
MKRHPSLTPLSREHHGALILARLLQKDAPLYKGLPADDAGKAEYALNFYKDELAGHFMDEEKILPLVKGISSELDRLADSIVEEHEILRLHFGAIPGRTNLEDHLDILGKALESHVRKEERQLFPLIQDSCTEEVLFRIERILSEN